MVLDSTYRLRDGGSKGNDMQLGAPRRINRDRIGADKFLKGAVLYLLARVAAQYTVGHHGANGFGTAGYHHFRRFAECACSICNIVKNHNVLTVNISEHANLGYFIEIRTILIADNHRHFAIGHHMQFFRKSRGTLRASYVR